MTDLEQMEYDRLDKEQRALFRRSVRQGTSPRMALMLASRQAPAVRGTGDQFIKTARERFASQSETSINRQIRVANRHGINTSGRVHSSDLGSVFDQHAWIKDEHDAAGYLKDAGYERVGGINFAKKPEKKAAPAAKLAADLEQEIVSSRLAADAALAARCKRNPRAMASLREEVQAKHGPQPLSPPAASSAGRKSRRTP